MNDVRNLPIRLPESDVLAARSIEMTDLHSTLRTKSAHFKTIRSSEYKINRWPSRLTHWWTLDFAEFVKALKVKLTLAQKDKLLPVFEKYKAELSALDAEIQRLDREIDQLVYQLYELTPEEIALVEASV